MRPGRRFARFFRFANDSLMVPEDVLEENEAGLVPEGEGAEGGVRPVRAARAHGNEEGWLP
jgi:hypothetical protein